MTGGKQKITWQFRHRIFNAIIKLNIGREEELNFENIINKEAYCVLYPFNAYEVIRDWFLKELDLIQ